VTPEDIWRGKRDDELVDAAGRLDQYFESGQWAILSELARRGLRMPNGDLPQVPERPVADPTPVVARGSLEASSEPPSGTPSGTPPDAPTGPAEPLRLELWPPGPALARLWRGEFPLFVTYWGFAQLGGLLLAVPQLGTRAFGYPGVAMAFDAVAVVYSAIVIVAIWRSARRYRGNRIWADLARLATVLPLVQPLVRWLSQG